MNVNDILLDFERKYSFFYDIQVNGVPVYTCLRDGVASRLVGNVSKQPEQIVDKKGKIFARRIVHSFIKIKKLKNVDTLVFTSSIFRRDKGRNMAAEYLMEKFSSIAIFEWPSRNTICDKAYFNDALKSKYCPLDYYLVLYKIYNCFNKKEYAKLVEDCKQFIFEKTSSAIVDSYQEQAALNYIIESLPKSYAEIVMSQRVFKRLFRNYNSVTKAVDFWGGARENIVPILPGSPQSIELQHGIITSIHPGYIFPSFVKDYNLAFFKRKILVYGVKTKELLVNQSIFEREQIEVIGNPRIIQRCKEFVTLNHDKNLILFTSQPYEQDGTGKDYYSSIIPFLQSIACFAREKGFYFGIKLHPRESNKISNLYLRYLPNVSIFDNSSDLYELLGKCKLHVTISSTTLYEASIFETPTICIRYIHNNLSEIYGFEPIVIESPENTVSVFNNVLVEKNWMDYLSYLKVMTKQYM